MQRSKAQTSATGSCKTGGGAGGGERGAGRHARRGVVASSSTSAPSHGQAPVEMFGRQALFFDMNGLQQQLDEEPPALARSKRDAAWRGG